jgi:hypothetical protein
MKLFDETITMAPDFQPLSIQKVIDIQHDHGRLHPLTYEACFLALALFDASAVCTPFVRAQRVAELGFTSRSLREI